MLLQPFVKRKRGKMLIERDQIGLKILVSQYLRNKSLEFYLMCEQKRFCKKISLPTFAHVIGFSASRRELKGKTGVNPALSP